MKTSLDLIIERVCYTLNDYKGKNGFFIEFEGTTIETELTTSKQAIELFKRLKREVLSVSNDADDIENIFIFTEFKGNELSFVIEYDRNSFDYLTLFIENL